MKTSNLLTSNLLLTLTLAALVGACAPVTSYTDAEAPKNLKLDSTTVQLDVRFAPGSASLAPGEAAHLRQLAASGRIAPSDRVSVTAAGDSNLARQRFASIASLLLHYGVVPVAAPPADVPPNHVLVGIGRTLVTLPACPNWSKPSSVDFDNQPSSNFGCATETNLGMMVANPSDLAGGLPAGAAAGRPAASAVGRYLTDKVVLPTANTALPIATQGAPGADTGNGTGTGGS
jgi:pilus assembly protein CpaD